MKICKIAAHACIRVQKMALPLMQRGHKVYLLSQKVPTFADAYDGYSQCFSVEQMRNMIVELSEWADVFHCHNEPSWFVTLVKENCDKPVVLDVHDSYLARSTPEEADEANKAGKKHMRISTEERNNFQLADALVFPAQPFADMIISEFKLTQPYIILPSYLPRNLYNYMASEWQGGIVYEGRFDLKPDLIEKGHTGFEYTDYTEFSQECKNYGVDFHFYGRHDEKFLKACEPIHATENSPHGIICHAAEPYNKLMKAISKHDWGLVGNIFTTPEWKVALPNKLFEYIAAGVPAVSMNADYCSQVIAEGGFGITVKSVEELTERWSEHTECRKVLLRTRSRYMMENHIHRLEQLYQQIK